MVGRLLYHWEGNFLGAMLNFGGVHEIHFDSARSFRVLSTTGNLVVDDADCFRFWSPIRAMRPLGK